MSQIEVSAPAGRQFLTFALAGEEYGVDILKVQEIRSWSAITRLPLAPAYVRGLLNLRGAIVPVVDLRLRLGLSRTECTPATVVIVLGVREAARERVVGVAVDAVSDVIDLARADIRPAPDFGSAIQAGDLLGLAQAGARMTILLDADRLLAMDAGGTAA